MGMLGALTIKRIGGCIIMPPPIMPPPIIPGCCIIIPPPMPCVGREGCAPVSTDEAGRTDGRAATVSVEAEQPRAEGVEVSDWAGAARSGPPEGVDAAGRGGSNRGGAAQRCQKGLGAHLVVELLPHHSLLLLHPHAHAHPRLRVDDGPLHRPLLVHAWLLVHGAARDIWPDRRD